MNNKRQQLFMVGALLGAWLIIDTNLTLPSSDNGPTHVMSEKKTHMRHTIHNPTLDWACYHCVNAQHGSIRKHQFKVLMLLQPNLAEGTIAWFCGSLKRTSQGGLKNLFSPQVGAPHHIMKSSPPSIHKSTTLVQVNVEEQFQNMPLDMVDVANGNPVLLEHYLNFF